MNFFKTLIAEARRHKFATPAFLLMILAMIILPLPPVLLDVIDRKSVV